MVGALPARFRTDHSSVRLTGMARQGYASIDRARAILLMAGIHESLIETQGLSVQHEPSPLWPRLKVRDREISLQRRAMTSKYASMTFAALFVAIMTPVTASGGEILCEKPGSNRLSHEIMHNTSGHLSVGNKGSIQPGNAAIRVRPGSTRQADGVFDSRDLVQAIQAGRYND